jgi:hypothetical protein
MARLGFEGCLDSYVLVIKWRWEVVGPAVGLIETEAGAPPGVVGMAAGQGWWRGSRPELEKKEDCDSSGGGDAEATPELASGGAGEGAREARLASAAAEARSGVGKWRRRRGSSNSPRTAA